MPVPFHVQISKNNNNDNTTNNSILNTTDCGMEHPPPVFFLLLSVYISTLRGPTHESCSYLKVIPDNWVNSLVIQCLFEFFFG